jgi:proline iminopeptidase
VLFDQRGSGRSRPHASEPSHDFATNTTEHLLGDMERLREHLGIERWVLFGGSWGSTLVLAYAERWPGRVTGIVLGGVTMTRRREIDWLCRGGLAMFYPGQWQRFEGYAREHSNEPDIVAAYNQMLLDPGPVVHLPAAQEWCRWESAVISPHPGPELQERFQDDRFALGFARLVTHYFLHDAWLEPEQLLRNAGRLAGIPGVLIHGRLDMGGMETPWLLRRAWKGSVLHVAEDASHSIHEPGMTARIVTALDGFGLD